MKAEHEELGEFGRKERKKWRSSEGRRNRGSLRCGGKVGELGGEVAETKNEKVYGKKNMVDKDAEEADIAQDTEKKEEMKSLGGG